MKNFSAVFSSKLIFLIIFLLLSGYIFIADISTDILNYKFKQAQSYLVYLKLNYKYIKIQQKIHNKTATANDLDQYQIFYQKTLNDIRNNIHTPHSKDTIKGKFILNSDDFGRITKNEKVKKCKNRTFDINQKDRILINQQLNPEADLDFFSKISQYSITPPAIGIPHNLHYIWSSVSQEHSSVMPKNISKTMSYTIDKMGENWKIFIWTNDENSIADEFKNNPNIKIKLYYQEFPEYSKYFKMLSSDKKFLSPLSDLLRYLILDQYGGLYLDVDYRLCKPVDDLLKPYDFVIGKEGSMYAAGGFLASAPSHPINKFMKQTIINNLSSDSAEKHVKMACNQISWVSMAMGPIALNIAFYKNANQDHFKDIMLEKKLVLSTKNAKSLPEYIDTDSKEYCEFLPTISYGNDSYAGSWIDNTSQNSNNFNYKLFMQSLTNNDSP